MIQPTPYASTPSADDAAIALTTAVIDLITTSYAHIDKMYEGNPQRLATARAMFAEALLGCTIEGIPETSHGNDLMIAMHEYFEASCPAANQNTPLPDFDPVA